MEIPDKRENSPTEVNQEVMQVPLEDRYRLLVETVEEYAIFMLDADGIVSSWNAGAQKINGYTSDEIIGKHFSVFFTSTDVKDGWPEHELKIAAETGYFTDEGWRVRSDGTMFWAGITITAIHNSQRELVGYAKIERDMSERKRLEELEASGARMNEFLAMLAHELRNPLAPIRNAISIMQIEPSLSQTTRNCRDIIDRQLSHMTRLVDDLLDVGRITTGKITLNRKVLDVREAVARSVESTRHYFSAKGQQFDVDVPERDFIVNGDLTRLVQVISNLLNNASKFTANGGHIILTVHDDERSIIIKVTDNGRGMTVDALKEIFNLFVQEDAQINPSESGLGIGLTLCRSLVEMHGGAIDAMSPGRGRGSTFTIRLPKYIPKAAGPFVDSNGKVSEHPVYKVLVVDDSKDSADSMALYLGMMGHETRAVYDGRTAIAVAKAFIPDIVLLDLAMPGLDGFQVREYLKNMPELAHTVISAMTGFGGEEARQRSLSTGFDDHLTKPVTPSAIKRVLDMVEDDSKA
jgi:PAS domain S-box-containing protein